MTILDSFYVKTVLFLFPRLVTTSWIEFLLVKNAKSFINKMDIILGNTSNPVSNISFK